jgi:hypothetical protein
VEREPTSTVNGVCPDYIPDGHSQLDPPIVRGLTLALDRFALEALEEECAQLGVSVEELARFAVLYYLADLDSGRIARQLPAELSAGGQHPLRKLLDG